MVVLLLNLSLYSLSLDYSPTGKEFVTGSYDRTLRIFPKDEGKSREVYHTRRMQRIFAVQYSGDSEYVFCGSDDSNIRIWKTIAHTNSEVVCCSGR
jgi:WD repeat and SOF domain-containing protein 1